jgi:hypothetical protein
MVEVVIEATEPEVRAMSQMAAIDPEKLAAAFNDPEHFFEHLDLEGLRRFAESCVRLQQLQGRMIASTERYASYARGLLAGLRAEA